MRLSRLELRAFGPFSDETLRFEKKKGRDLHLVYGRNEAGKSTTLRAVKGLLFGIPRDTSDAYLHAANKLCVGASIDTSSGERTIYRRKRKAMSLTDENGVEVASDWLVEQLGGLDEKTFSKRLGIDQEELERGADALLSGSEEGLFAAGTGGSEMRDLLRELSRRGEELYKRQGKNPLLNQALQRYQLARKYLSDQVRPPEVYERQHKELDEVSAELANLIARRRALRQEERESSRLLAVLGDLAAIVSEKNALEALGEVIVLPAEASLERQEAERELREASVLEAELSRQLKALREEYEALAGPSPLEGALFERALLENLLGSERKAMADVGKLRSTLALVEGELRTIAKGLGFELPKEEALDAAAERLPGRAEEAGIRALCAEIGRLEEGERILLEQLRDLDAELSEEPREPPGLDVEIEELGGALEGKARIGELLEEARRLQKAIRVSLEKLSFETKLFPNVQESLLEFVPSRETVEGARREVSLVEAELSGLLQSRLSLVERRSRIRSELEVRRARAPKLRKEDLFERRRSRDEAFEALVSEPVSASRVTEARNGIVEADEVSDELLRHSDEIGRIEGFERDLLEIDETLRIGEERKLEVERRGVEVRRRIEAMFVRAGIELPFEECANLVVKLEGVRSLFVEKRALEASYEACLGELGREKEAIEPLRAKYAGNLPPMKLGGLLEVLSLSLEERLRTRERVRVARENRAKEARKLEVLRARHREGALRKERSVRELGVRLRALGLSELLRVEEIEAMLGMLTELQTRVEKGRELKRRIDGIDRDTHNLATRLEELATAHGIALVGKSLVDRGEWFLREAANAEKVRESRVKIELELAATKERLAELGGKRGRHEHRLRLLAEAARVASPEELPRAEARSVEAVTRRARLRELENRVLTDAGGESLDDLLGRAKAVTAQSLSIRIAELSDEHDELEAVIRQQESKKGALEAGLARFKTVDVAESRQTLSSRGTEARALLVLALKNSLKTKLLEEQMRDFARRMSGPLAFRAGEIFRSITLDAYDGLEVGLGDRTVRCRRGSELIEVSHLSRGTSAQLYLALRLASLELYFEKNEPVPVVFDDLFVDFDDDRTTAAFEVLASLAERTQVLYFTHLSRDLELAQSASDAVSVHLLGVR